MINLLPNRTPPERIESIVAEAYGITPELLHRKTREEWIVWPRQVTMALIHEAGGYTYQRIAIHFGRREHGTAMHAVKLVRNREAAYPKLRKALNKLRERIRES